ncbi:MAG: hypothetical protein A2Z32_03865 [Chloroflexi bacterium RBG_16_69_14]|nr:MAG: hypothetical protein A2Z32_03865 [Chloroflexi bacterium RBG_16_69_14]
MAAGALSGDDRGGRLMGYLARLMSETGLGAGAPPRPSPVTRLDVDVIRESAPTDLTPAAMAVGVLPGHRPASPVESPDTARAAEHAISPPAPLPSVPVVPDAPVASVDPPPTPAPEAVVETIERTIVAATPEPARTVEIEQPALVSAIEPSGPSVDRAGTAVGDVAMVSPTTAAPAGDPPSERRAVAAVGSEPLPVSLTVTHTPDPPVPVSAPVRDEGQWLREGLAERDVSARGPELQSIALSIGSIEVVVEGPPQPATASPSNPTPALSQPTVVDDLPRRLRRDYVTWPEGW